MKISKYKGLYVLTEEHHGKVATLACGWDREDLEREKRELEEKRCTSSVCLITCCRMQ